MLETSALSFGMAQTLISSLFVLDVSARADNKDFGQMVVLQEGPPNQDNSSRLKGPTGLKKGHMTLKRLIVRY